LSLTGVQRRIHAGVCFMAAPLTLVRTGKPRGCELLSSLECECLSSGTALGFGFRKHTETDGKRQRGTDQGRRMACERRLSRDPQLVAWSQTHTCDTDCAGVSESVSDRLIGSKICPQQTLFQFGKKTWRKVLRNFRVSSANAFANCRQLLIF
jgi:hypothetical protein